MPRYFRYIILSLAWVAVAYSIYSNSGSTYPLLLRHGEHIHVPAFKTHGYSGEYYVGIVADRLLPFDDMNCLMGTHGNPKSELCKRIPETIHIAWKVSNGGNTISEYTTERDEVRGSSSTSSTLGRGLGTFSAEAGKEYLFDLDVLADGGALSTTHPRLVIEHRLPLSMIYQVLILGLIFVTARILLVSIFKRT